MRNSTIFLLPLLFGATLAACANGDKAGDDTDTDATSDTDVAVDTDVAIDTDVAPLAKPALGDQIDRVGRPAVSTLLVDAFNSGSMADITHDNYNQDASASTWASSWSAKIAASAAIWDSFDTSCGNSIAAGGGSPSGATYNITGSLFADDQLYVNAAGTDCTQYMSVELGAIGLFSDGSCGGRTPAYDTTDVTLSLLIIGQESGVGDGVSLSMGDDKFPFLAAPN